jgi:PIN domain nuclease of toxin-antitoxin system
VRLLLDTHALLWWLADDPGLSEAARSAVGDPRNVVAVSAASAWEMSIKTGLGKLRAPDDLSSELDANGFLRLAISIEHALRAGALPPHHRDPFDRMLVAQAELESLTIVTRDQRFEPYAVPLLAA